MSKNLFKNKWFLRLIGISIFIFIILYKINFREIISNFSEIKIKFLLLAIIIMFASTIIKPFRWQYILKGLNINYPFWKVYKIYFIGIFMGIFTPGRFGEMGKIIYLRKDNHPLNQSLMSVIMDRLADMFYLIVFGFLGLFLFFSYFKKAIFIIAPIILAVIIFLFLMKNNRFKLIFKKIISFLIPAKYKQKAEESFSEFINILYSYKFKNYLNIFIFTLFSWLVSYVSVYFLARSVNINNLPFFYLIISMNVTSLITILPISISGIGTREATLLLLLGPLNILPEQIVGFSLLIFITNFIIVPVIGLGCWLINPIPQNK